MESKARDYQILSKKPRLIRRKILVINLIILLIPIVGIFWLTTYRQTLIDAEYKYLETQAKQLAVAISEGAILQDNYSSSVPFSLNIIQNIIHRATEDNDIHIRVWDRDGEFLLSNANRRQAIFDKKNLPEIGSFSYFYQKIKRRLFNFLADIAWSREDISSKPPSELYTKPVFLEEPQEVKEALSGETKRMMLSPSYNEAKAVLSIATPIQRYRHTYGAVQILMPTKDIDNSLSTLYFQFIIIFTIAILTTVMLSYWLGKTIAKPIYKLATAANNIRLQNNRKQNIPDLSYRQDEIGVLSTSLRHMTSSLWDRMDAIERFAADVAHEIKNPLTSLKSAVETIRLAKKDEQKQMLLKIIEHDVDRIDRLISDISDASRLDSELSKENADPVNIVELCSNIVAHYKDTNIDKVNISFVNKTKKQEIIVLGHKDRFAQVVHNLIDNAISFSPAGGNIFVNIIMHSSGDNIEVQVVDEGQGIPKGAEEKIFQRFYSERPNNEGFGNHSGLGLSISRQIAQSYGGSLTAENSKDTSGAIFRFILPI